MLDPNRSIADEVEAAINAGSAEKHLETIKRVKERKFTGGLYDFGLPQDGVGYVYDEHNRAMISDATRARVEALKQEIVAGRIMSEVRTQNCEVLNP